MESIKKAKSTLVRQGIPSTVYHEFVEQICLAVNLENPDETYTQDPEIQEVRNQQSRLGEEALMKGFLHKEWTRALNDRWTPAPPTEDGKKVHQKDALEQTVCLQRVLWDIFEAQWKCRNASSRWYLGLHLGHLGAPPCGACGAARGLRLRTETSRGV